MSQQPCPEQVALKARPDLPRRGGHFVHFKGGHYDFCYAALTEWDKTPVIVYRNAETGEVWVRTVDSWNTPAEKDGVPVKRFEEMFRLCDREIRDLAQEIIDDVKRGHNLLEAYTNAFAGRNLHPLDKMEVWEVIPKLLGVAD